MTIEYRVFWVILARDSRLVRSKIRELNWLGIRDFIVICGEPVPHERVVYREPRGKWDAINFSMSFVPQDTDVVIFHDVDTILLSWEPILKCLEDPSVGVAYGKVLVFGGPQSRFYSVFDRVRKRFPWVAASGELLAVKRELLEKIVPIPPNKAEDTYIMLKALKLGYRVVFCDDAKVLTWRTRDDAEEERYKERTVTGILQALHYADPPAYVKAVYYCLPFAAPLIAAAGGIGAAKGLLKAYIRYYFWKDREGKW